MGDRPAACWQRFFCGSFAIPSVRFRSVPGLVVSPADGVVTSVELGLDARRRQAQTERIFECFRCACEPVADRGRSSRRSVIKRACI